MPSGPQRERLNQIAIGNSYLYVLHFPPTITPQFDFGAGLQNACTPNAAGAYWCGYHGTLASRHTGTRLTYAVIPDHNGNCATNTCAAAGLASCDAMTVTESHEIAEALTDPDTSTGITLSQSRENGHSGAIEGVGS